MSLRAARCQMVQNHRISNYWGSPIRPLLRHVLLSRIVHADDIVLKIPFYGRYDLYRGYLVIVIPGNEVCVPTQGQGRRRYRTSKR
jgi:hypothetical protein